MKFFKNKLLVLLVLLAACKPDHTLIIPEVKPLLEGVYASGFVVSMNEYQVIAQAEGYLKEKLVKEGDSVKIGEPLFILESAQQQSRKTLAQENYGVALKNYQEDSPVLNELKSVVESAKSKLAYDSLNYVRYGNLLRSNATSRAEFDRMKLLYENSKNEYRLQQSRYEKALNQVYIEFQNARSQQQIAQDESERYIVRSQVNGKVFSTMKEKGELVRRNEAVAVVGSNEFYLQLSVDELDIQRVTAGQEVLVKIDAYPDKIFKAHVNQVFPMVNPQQQSLRVDAYFDEPLPGGFSGLAVEANIVIRKKENALVIPKSALLNGDTVQLKTDEGVKKVKVITGIKTLDEVEIMEGIDAESKIIGE